MTHFQINIVGDKVCPWCYVGKKRLERGIAAYREKYVDTKDTFSTTWFPFYLNPHAPKGADKRQWLETKFGKEPVAEMQRNLSQLGPSEGIEFKHGGKTGNTRDSHRLIQLGKTKGWQMQTSVVAELFAAYFEHEQDITNPEILVEIGAKAGLHAQEVEDWLASGKGGVEADEEADEAVAQGIHTVPNFTVNGIFKLSGTQEPATFVELFELANKRETSR